MFFNIMKLNIWKKGLLLATLCMTVTIIYFITRDRIYFNTPDRSYFITRDRSSATTDRKTSYQSHIPHSTVLQKRNEPTRPWMVDPDVIPPVFTHSNHTSLYPDPAYPWDDRIAQQLAYTPSTPPTHNKTILAAPRYIRLQAGHEQFKGCKVSQCVVTYDINEISKADLVLAECFEPGYQLAQKALQYRSEKPEQILADFNHEAPHIACSPYRTSPFNWTVSYNPSATIAVPYGKYVPIAPGGTTRPQTKGYSANKQHNILWIVSNCHLIQNKRMQYVKELQCHTQVDIYGRCGKPMCYGHMATCMRDLISKYKFYLAFENSNCDTYVTEKMYINALDSDVLPIVMGALPEFYKRVAPPNSYIHVADFPSPKHLAQYIDLVNSNDTLYNSYFQWKGAWGLMKDMHLACRLCALLHAPPRTTITTHKSWAQSEHCRRSDLPDAPLKLIGYVTKLWNTI